MKLATFSGKAYRLDDYGYLNPPDQWDHDFAEGMAETLGIVGGLTEAHWSFIRYLRDKFLIEKSVPVVVIACADNRLRLDDFRSLFPTGYFRGACKIAGLNHDFMCGTNYWITYETTPILKERYRVSPLGFLEDFDSWDEQFAVLMAREWGLAEGLTGRHRAIIAYLRDYYGRNRQIPTIIETCKANDLSLEEMEVLFPAGYRRGACRMAGLPFLG